ncbi:glucuronate isomerase [Halobacillus ihumii]|uniref:glucuronate isomerase n=1 Tax=Halobacillus ihumii TaxID=2686092 RepID=UPI0013D4EC09|nr:glucuronate isomerase [Halobacillus ihumii]
MKTFIHDDFLLENKYAQELYHDYAKDLPIIDYHNHLPPSEIAEDKQFPSISDVWLAGDHYKWRLMRANGIDEKYISGSASDKEKFKAWAETVPNTLGNPLYHWTHLELLRFFNIKELLNKDSAEEIWNTTNEKLADNSMSTRNLLQNSKVEFVGTTDDPTDDLAHHTSLKQEKFSVEVAPSFRPDKALDIEAVTFGDWVKKLREASGIDISDYASFLSALSNRVDYFEERGCRASDHSIEVMFFKEASEEDAQGIYAKKINGHSLTPDEVEQYKTYTLQFLASQYKEKNWVMQFHLGALRNNNTKMLRQAGTDSGFDSMGDRLLAQPLSNFLDSLEVSDILPKTVLYCLNPRDNYILATMAGNFQDGSVPGKIQFGTAWWYNDHINGMENQMEILANVGLIKHFVGMLTDSRSFLSFSRHEYFRRILANLFGKWVEKGIVPADMDLLGSYIEDISYYNARRYLNLK